MKKHTFVTRAAAAVATAIFAAACGSPMNPNAPSPAGFGSTTQGAGGGASTAGKVDVCHRNGGGYNLLSISGNALPAHLAHGDGQPGGAVPGGGTFTAACGVQLLQQYTLTLVSGNGGSYNTTDPGMTYSMTGSSGNPVILITHPAYASLPGAQWVNWGFMSFPEFGYGLPHLDNDVTYSKTFTLPAGATNISLTGTFYADNRGDAFLNGTLIGAQPAGPAWQSGYNTPGVMSASSGFTPGVNTLSVKVQDYGGVAGVTFSAIVTYFAQ